MSIIEDQRTFEELIRELRSARTFALDTEFIRERTYRPRLCLIQIGLPEKVAAIDPFAVRDLQPLLALVADPTVEKVVHAGQQDMEIFFVLGGSVPRNVFDTQVAASLLGYGESIGHSRLVEDLLGIQLGRAEAYTDWAARPLSRSQVEYALSDVRHLLILREKLLAELERLARTAWFREESEAYERETLYRREPRSAYARVSGARKLSRRGLAVLRELAAWREKEAEELDRPRGRILSDALLVEVARREPRSVRDLGALRGIHPRLLQRSGKAFVHAVRQGLECPPADYPDPLGERAGDAGPAIETVVDLLEVLLKVRAAEERIAPSYLATRSELVRLARSVLGGKRANDLRVLEGWRREAVGEDLIALLEGRLRMGVDAGTGRITAAAGGGPAGADV